MNEYKSDSFLFIKMFPHFSTQNDRKISVPVEYEYVTPEDLYTLDDMPQELQNASPDEFINLIRSDFGRYGIALKIFQYYLISNNDNIIEGCFRDKIVYLIMDILENDSFYSQNDMMNALESALYLSRFFNDEFYWPLIEKILKIAENIDFPLIYTVINIVSNTMINNSALISLIHDRLSNIFIDSVVNRQYDNSTNALFNYFLVIIYHSVRDDSFIIPESIVIALINKALGYLNQNVSQVILSSLCLLHGIAIYQNMIEILISNGIESTLLTILQKHVTSFLAAAYEICIICYQYRESINQIPRFAMDCSYYECLANDIVDADNDLLKSICINIKHCSKQYIDAIISNGILPKMIEMIPQSILNNKLILTECLLDIMKYVPSEYIENICTDRIFFEIESYFEVVDISETIYSIDSLSTMISNNDAVKLMCANTFTEDFFAELIEKCTCASQEESVSWLRNCLHNDNF